MLLELLSAGQRWCWGRNVIGGVFSASVPQRGMQTVWLGVCYYSQIERNLTLPVLMSVTSGSCVSYHMIGVIHRRAGEHLVMLKRLTHLFWALKLQKATKVRIRTTGQIHMKEFVLVVLVWRHINIAKERCFHIVKDIQGKASCSSNAYNHDLTSWSLISPLKFSLQHLIEVFLWLHQMSCASFYAHILLLILTCLVSLETLRSLLEYKLHFWGFEQCLATQYVFVAIQGFNRLKGTWNVHGLVVCCLFGEKKKSPTDFNKFYTLNLFPE